MKFMEITGGFILPVNNDEQELIRVLEKNDSIWKADLDDFGISIAEKMVSKGLLTRIEEHDKIGYKPNIGDPNA